MKAISYSLFGYSRDAYTNCFSFSSYLRGLHICVRFNRILFPEWINVVNIDEATYNSPYRPIFDWHESKGFIRINLCPNNEPLCKAMLWRLKTVFSYTHPHWDYTHVICRDLDSIATYREAQAVQEWIDEDKAMHCITDSISHTIPMMGGMVGFRPGYVNDLMQLNINPENAWEKLLSFAPDINYNVKGSDQDFLGRVMYPRLCQNSTEHFVKGRPHDLIEGNGRHYSIGDVDIQPDPKFKETNLLAGHIGAAGFYEAPTMRFLHYDDPYRDEYKDLETMKEFDKIFYWSYREDLR
jgi:hypothetical protein